jgi:hypothetical protein
VQLFTRYIGGKKVDAEPGNAPVHHALIAS